MIRQPEYTQHILWVCGWGNDVGGYYGHYCRLSAILISFGKF
ncbi:hypothetical protein AO366_1630 [Moraxella catarrhalis]|uniref:Uncharacterized protein n=1 Tax=Moraxella catarrhalis TaxID=480 RepID=A0A7Z0UZB2_MORCA|nr:hypothetical protein AO382_0694 [Moraxella catarrhalis]OAV13149.1 hypothetical protein AO376_1737 [Moraxella catarrhalis]OAV17137.1 hypothetical protein AO374_1264 [Moraxella catarrhalis]OAV29485.1 hypothetical protein AO369_0165 [Moraxella catarrhalis]OAV32070.1 hypothetical protein AO366_1630 [Moraxella catarrhalis]